jgi:hypothetical protein
LGTSRKRLPAFEHAENSELAALVTGNPEKDREPSGNEGLADVRVINAIYQSAKTGRTVRIEPVPKRRRPDREMEIKRPPVEQPELVGASAPHS